MSAWHLAQLNIARMLAPVDSPQLAGFVNNLERVNALADSAPGFVWRLQSESGDATEFRPFGDDTLINMSLWQDLESLHHYVYRGAHVEIMRHRKEWFELLREAYSVLWWIPQGALPTVEEGVERLALLREKGATTEAFTFAKAYPAPDTGLGKKSLNFDDTCPA